MPDTPASFLTARILSSRHFWIFVYNLGPFSLCVSLPLSKLIGFVRIPARELTSLAAASIAHASFPCRLQIFPGPPPFPGVEYP
jgi:hypothetical protein